MTCVLGAVHPIGSGKAQWNGSRASVASRKPLMRPGYRVWDRRSPHAPRPIPMSLVEARHRNRIPPARWRTNATDHGL